jgi:hypothetical protein
MFDIDNISNFVIFLIPVALIVTRLINRAKAKNAPPPKKPPAPYIPVHFEDDTEEELEYLKNRDDHVSTAVSQQAKVPPRKTFAGKAQKSVASPFAAKPEMPVFGLTPPPVPAKSVRPLLQQQKDFSFNFSHLSQMKQAVLMAEILGKPKGITGE